jgi:uncharacterized protein
MRYFKALLLTEGAHGMVSQVEGLAKALKLDFNHCFVNLKKTMEILSYKFSAH